MSFLYARGRNILGLAIALAAVCLPASLVWGISPGTLPFPAPVPEAKPAVIRGASPGTTTLPYPVPSSADAQQMLSLPAEVGHPVQVSPVAPPHFSAPNLQPPLPSAETVQAELCKRRSCWDKLCHRLPQSEISDLANLIDDLDRDLFRVGVVAVKEADVWTQNRMTKFRAEYENEMIKNITTFRPILSARQRQADSATLTSATALGLAMPTTSNTTARSGGTITQVTPPPAPPTTAPTPVVFGGTPVLGTPADKAGNPLAVVHLNPAAAATDPTDAIGLEPTIVLDEQSRYLQHLQQLRRINTGDDKAEMPGYGLYLLRMPVSILPGPETFKGKGASVTVQASHQLPPDLLPITFRDFATNDLANALAPVLTRLLDDDEVRPLTATDLRDAVRAEMAGHSAIGRVPGGSGLVQARFAPPIPPKEAPFLLPDHPFPAPAGTPRNPAPGSPTALRTMRLIRKATYHRSTGSSPAGPGRLNPLTNSEVDEIFGPALLLSLAADIKDAQDHSGYSDFSVRDWLREEIKGTYDFIRANGDNPHFGEERVNEIGRLIDTRSYSALQAMRDSWVVSLPGYGQPGSPSGLGQMAIPRPVESLAYGIVVEQYQLDKLLKYDMERVAHQKGCLPGDPRSETFYALNPTPAARAMYNAYVAAKWPIHVFAIDPVVDQQNVQDVSSLRRELQIALAVSLATGQSNFNQTLNYARRLEVDIETIGLNRTAVGFGAGDRTFGWKFYPRVQTLQRESNPRAIADLLLFNGPGPYYDVRHRKMEPGLRECTALVVMPTFVPFLKLDTSINWFGLIGCCAKQVLDTKDMLAMGQKVQLAKGALAQFKGSCCYRPTDLQGLSARVDQLEAQLPIQNQLVEFPYENSLGGSEVFIEGYSHLAPQLNDWYGSPANGREFSVFVKGHHFSVHETKVIAGGVELPAEKFYLLSRDLMRITVPANAVVKVEPMKYRDRQTGIIVSRMVPTIDVHVASPNGLSNHLLIEMPALNPADCPVASGFHWSLPTVYTARYTFGPDAKPVWTLAPGDTLLPPTNEFLIQAPPSYFAPPSAPASMVLTVESANRVLYTVTQATVNFDTKRNVFYVLGSEFKTLNDSVLAGVNAALNTAQPTDLLLKPPTEPLVVSAKLIIAGSVYPIDNKLTIGLNKVAKPVN